MHVFGAVPRVGKQTFATNQTMKFEFDRQYRRFIDALFIDLKMLHIFKLMIPEGVIIADAVTKGLMERDK